MQNEQKKFTAIYKDFLKIPKWWMQEMPYNKL